MLVNNRTVLAACILLAQAQCATADELNWSGAYLGLKGGWQSGQGNFQFVSDDRVYTTSPNLTGLAAGANLGFLKQFDNGFIVGAELDANILQIANKNSQFYQGGDPISNIFGSTKMNWDASARIRAGYAFNRFMPYVTGGLAMANVDYGYDVLPPFKKLFKPSQINDSLFGWTIGAGAEFALTEKLSTRLEYRYSDFGPASNTIVFDGFDSPSKFKLNDSRIEFGLSYKL
jgi:outer membrane immunogenic protein